MKLPGARCYSSHLSKRPEDKISADRKRSASRHRRAAVQAKSDLTDRSKRIFSAAFHSPSTDDRPTTHQHRMGESRGRSTGLRDHRRHRQRTAHYRRRQIGPVRTHRDTLKLPSRPPHRGKGPSTARSLRHWRRCRTAQGSLRTGPGSAYMRIAGARRFCAIPV